MTHRTMSERSTSELRPTPSPAERKVFDIQVVTTSQTDRHHVVTSEKLENLAPFVNFNIYIYFL